MGTMLTVRLPFGLLAPRSRRVFLCAVVALLSLVSCASASAALNLTGTWSAVYHCEVGTCAGTEIPATDTLTQAVGSEVVTGSNGTEAITGTLKGNTFEFVSTTTGYEAKGTLTVAADGQSWSGPLSDSNSTSGTYTATRDPVPPGSLSQLAVPFNCIGEEGFHQEAIGCGKLLPAKTLENSYEAKVSPDGRFVYSVAEEGDLIEYSRNLASGALTVIGCITATTEACASENVTTSALEMKAPQALAISADGASVYVVTFEGVLVEFERNTETGLLIEASCIGHEVTSACAAKGAKGLHEPYGVAISPNGKNVYVASNGDGAVAEFSRNTTTGALTQLASANDCISSSALSECGTIIAGKELERAIGLVVSPDERNVYVAAGSTAGEGAIVALERNESEEGALELLPTTEACVSEVLAECTKGVEINGPEDLVISSDGKNVYSNSFKDSAVLEFQREPSGALTQLASPNACVMNAPAAAGCTEGKGLQETLGVAISPGGENVYASSSAGDDEAAFNRDPETGVLIQLPAPYECAGKMETEGVKRNDCGVQGIRGIAGARRVTVSPDGMNLYVAGQDDHALVELRRAVTPTVTELSSNQGPYAGGNEVTIHGSGFIEGASVTFGSNSASNVRVSSPETLTATSPAGNGTADVVVTTFSGSSAVTSADNYAYGRVGGLNLNGYCEGIGDSGRDSKGGGPAVLIKEAVEGPEYAYNNWGCVQVDGTVVPVAVEGPAPSMDNACVVAFPGVADHGAPENPNNAFTWNCYEGAPPPEENKGTGGGGEPTAKTASLVFPDVLVHPLIVPPVVSAPVLVKTGNVAPVSGTVLVKLPGTSKFVPLSSLRQVPFGSIIEATHGTVSVTTAEPGGKTQTGEFFEGEFILRQDSSGVVIAELTGGNFAVCPTQRERSHIARAGSAPPASAASASNSHVVRKLWANAHGKFSTKGNYAAGAVQGTEWLTEDLCDGTLIKVTRDKVAVTNLVNHRHVEVTTGHHYLAKAP
jgi:hypothetical protein